MALQSQRHIRDFIFPTVSGAQSSGRLHEVCYVQETRTGYEFLEYAPNLTVDGVYILSTSYSTDSRWRAIYGKYEIGKYAVPLTSIAQNTVYVGEELPELVFDADGRVVMQMINIDEV